MVSTHARRLVLESPEINYQNMIIWAKSLSDTFLYMYIACVLMHLKEWNRTKHEVSATETTSYKACFWKN